MTTDLRSALRTATQESIQANSHLHALVNFYNEDSYADLIRLFVASAGDSPVELWSADFSRTSDFEGGGVIYAFSSRFVHLSSVAFDSNRVTHDGVSSFPRMRLDGITMRSVAQTDTADRPFPRLLKLDLRFKGGRSITLGDGEQHHNDDAIARLYSSLLDDLASVC